ncbi:MAG TPA: hypothetical protein VF463_10530 [Sphingobium sp.]
MSAVPPLTAEQIAALPPVAPGHARHIMKHPVAGLSAEDEPVILHYVDVRLDVTGADMMATDEGKGPVAKQLHLVARLTGQPFGAILKMREADVTALMEIGEDPIEPGRPTGGAPAA